MMSPLGGGGWIKLYPNQPNDGRRLTDNYPHASSGYLIQDTSMDSIGIGRNIQYEFITGRYYRNRVNTMKSKQKTYQPIDRNAGIRKNNHKQNNTTHGGRHNHKINTINVCANIV